MLIIWDVKERPKIQLQQQQQQQHDNGELESCQLCGHEQRLLDELVQPAVTVLCQSTAVCRTMFSIGIVRAP